jgi:hypothetical protein
MAQLQQGFAAGEMGFNDKFALQTILKVLVRFGSWLFSNSGRALAAVLGTSALCGRRQI